MGGELNQSRLVIATFVLLILGSVNLISLLNGSMYESFAILFMMCPRRIEIVWRNKK